MESRIIRSPISWQSWACVTLMSCVIFCLLAPPVASQCVTTCGTTTAGGMSCTVAANPCTMTSPTFAYICYANLTVKSGTMSAVCNIGTASDLMAAASHLPASGPSANCTFTFSARCAPASLACITGPFSGKTIKCVVAPPADALPVELMDFAIDSSDPDGDPDGESDDQDAATG